MEFETDDVSSTRVIEVEGQPLVYSVAGSGDPVVLVHGLSGSLRWWSRNIPALAREFRVYAVNLPDIASDEAARSESALSGAADWLAKCIQAVAGGPVHLIGHSLGGLLSIRVAARHPDLIRRLVLVAPAGVPHERSIIRYLGPLLRAARQVTPEFAPILAQDFVQVGPRTILRTAREVLREDVRDDLPNVTQPTLLVWGDEDPIVPATLGKSLHELIGGSELLVFKGTGHVPMIDEPDEFNRSVLEFLRH